MAFHITDKGTATFGAKCRGCPVRQHRPMAERSIAWVTANGHRRVRFIGIEANRLGLTIRAAALNLRRLINLGLGHDGTTWTIA